MDELEQILGEVVVLLITIAVFGLPLFFYVVRPIQRERVARERARLAEERRWRLEEIRDELVAAVQELPMEEEFTEQELDRYRGLIADTPDHILQTIVDGWSSLRAGGHRGAAQLYSVAKIETGRRMLESAGRREIDH